MEEEDRRAGDDDGALLETKATDLEDEEEGDVNAFDEEAIVDAAINARVAVALILIVRVSFLSVCTVLQPYVIDKIKILCALDERS